MELAVSIYRLNIALHTQGVGVEEKVENAKRSKSKRSIVISYMENAFMCTP